MLNHFKEYGIFTNPGLYEDYLKSLPDNPREIGKLLRNNIIHRTTLAAGNTWTNSDLKFGDMTKVPWYRQAEDDNLTTTTSIVAELFRRDSKGLTTDRKVEDKLVLTCRYIAILMASILKSKNIPARVRSGFAGYWPFSKVSSDHWINQYWNKNEQRWVTIDVDGSFHETGFDMYDFPEGKFDYAADAWIDVRSGKKNEEYFQNGDGNKGLIVVAWELFYDFHCLMNNEILYLHHPEFTFPNEFKNLPESKLKEIDELAKLLQNPDKNFNILQNIWNTNKEYRLLKGALL